MHKYYTGFTVVELMVVIVILVALVTMSVLGVRGMQASARDNERQTDIDSIATALESMYAKELRNSGGTVVKVQGSYPPVIKPASSSNPLGLLPEMLSELVKGSTTAPGQATGLRSAPANVCQAASVCTVSSSHMTTATSAAQITPNSYVYIPFTTSTGEVCTTAAAACNSYKLYYVFERSPTVVKIMESKR